MATTHCIQQHLMSKCLKNYSVQTLYKSTILLRPLSNFPVVHNELSVRKFSRMTSPADKVENRYCSHRLCSHHPVTIQQRTYVSDIIVGMAETGFTCFNSVHSVTGLPWWLTIALVVTPMRVGLQILKEYQVRQNSYKLSKVHKKMSEIVPAIRHASSKIGKDVSDSMDDKETLQALEKLRERDFKIKVRAAHKTLYSKHKCHPMQPVAFGILHLPIWISLSLSLREMAGLGYFFIKPREHIYQESFHTEGLLWFPDLIAPDPHLVLPLVASLSMLSSIELANLNKLTSNPDGTVPNIVKALNVFSRCTCVMLLLIGWYFPSAVTFYWSVSSLSANFVNVLLLSPRLIKVLKFKTLPTDSRTPYRDLWNVMKVRYNPVNWYMSIRAKLSRPKKVKENKEKEKEAKSK